MTKEEVFEKMIEEKKSIWRIDPWVPGQREPFNAIKEGPSTVKYKGLTFSITRKSGGGRGMGEYPPTVSISILHTFED